MENEAEKARKWGRMASSLAQVMDQFANGIVVTPTHTPPTPPLDRIHHFRVSESGVIGSVVSEDDPVPAPSLSPALSSPYFGKLTPSELQEALVQSMSHWLLSDDNGRKAAMPLRPTGHHHFDTDAADMKQVVIIIPKDQNLPQGFNITLAVLHQIIRDLVLGVFVFNQIPGLALQGSFDGSTLCSIPPCYHDTLLAQTLIDVDYTCKCIWHGAIFPPDKRRQFGQIWRSRLDVNSAGKAETKRTILPDFIHAGLIDICEFPGYEQAYSLIPEEFLCKRDGQMESCDWSELKSDMKIRLTFHASIACHGNVLLSDAKYDVTWALSSPPTKQDEKAREHLRLMADAVRNNIANNPDVRLQLEILKIAAAILPSLIQFKRIRKVVKLSTLMPPLPRKMTLTERELPPLMCSPEFKMAAFSDSSTYFHLNGGIAFELGSSLNDFTLNKESLEAINDFQNLEIVQSSPEDGAPPKVAPTLDLNEKCYWAIRLPLEKFISGENGKPLWSKALIEEMSWLKFKSLPMTSSQVLDRFSRLFGEQVATDIAKNPKQGLEAAASSGMAATFHSLLRECTRDQLNEVSSEGWSLMHVAAANDHVHLLGQLIQLGLDVNARRFSSSDGCTPLHVAAHNGAISAAECLVCCHADVEALDEDGWASVHRAADAGQLPILRLILGRFHKLVELETQDIFQRTPFLLSAKSGALQSMIWLIEFGARRDAMDADGLNCIHLAAVHRRIHILEHFINANYSNIDVWKIFSEMLSEKNAILKMGAVACLKVLLAKETFATRAITAGLPAILTQLLEGKAPINERPEVLATLSHISQDHRVVRVMSTCESIRILILVLRGNPQPDACRQAAKMIADIAPFGSNKDIIGENEGIAALFRHLTLREPKDIVEVLRALEMACHDHDLNKSRIVTDDLPLFFHLLSKNCDDVQWHTCCTLSALASGHSINQAAIAQKSGITQLLPKLLDQSSSLKIKKNALFLLQVLVQNNASNQSLMLTSGILETCISLLKIMQQLDDDLQERAARAIRALAGRCKGQQKVIAGRVGMHQLINMLITNSEELVCTSCHLVAALVYEDLEAQKLFFQNGGLDPLLRLLVPSATCSDNILVMVLQTVSILCLGEAYSGNNLIQTQFCKPEVLTALMSLSRDDARIQIGALETIACVVLNNKDNIKLLQTLGGFNLDAAMCLMKSNDEDIQCRAGTTLALYLFNKEVNMKDTGIKLPMEHFSTLMSSKNDMRKCFAAFQISVLSPMVRGQDAAVVTALGIELLVQQLSTEDEDLFVLAASLLSSLASYKSGIMDALVGLGLVELLLDKLTSKGAQIRTKCSASLGQLSFHCVARRRMLKFCRREPNRFEVLMGYLPKNASISKEFIQDFTIARSRGLVFQKK